MSSAEQLAAWITEMLAFVDARPSKIGSPSMSGEEYKHLIGLDYKIGNLAKRLEIALPAPEVDEDVSFLPNSGMGYFHTSDGPQTCPSVEWRAVMNTILEMLRTSSGRNLAPDPATKIDLMQRAMEATPDEGQPPIDPSRIPQAQREQQAEQLAKPINCNTLPLGTIRSEVGRFIDAWKQYQASRPQSVDWTDAGEVAISLDRLHYVLEKLGLYHRAVCLVGDGSTHAAVTALGRLLAAVPKLREAVKRTDAPGYSSLDPNEPFPFPLELIDRLKQAHRSLPDYPVAVKPLLHEVHLMAKVPAHSSLEIPIGAIPHDTCQGKDAADTFQSPALAQHTPATIATHRPGYPKPLAERLSFAGNRLAEVEQYIAPGEAVLASLLVSALLARECTTAEAMWAIFIQIEAGRYKATTLGDSTANYIVSEHNPPAGLNVASGVLHIDGGAGNYGLLVLTLPKPGRESSAALTGHDAAPVEPPTTKEPLAPKATAVIDQETQAIAALLTIGPNATQIAKLVGVPRTTLLGWKTFREQLDKVKAQAETTRQKTPRGFRTQTGGVEAWKEDGQEDDE